MVNEQTKDSLPARHQRNRVSEKQNKKEKGREELHPGTFFLGKRVGVSSKYSPVWGDKKKKKTPNLNYAFLLGIRWGRV